VNSDEAPPPGDSRKNLAIVLFVVGLLIYWLGGYGSCMGLAHATLKIVYPLVVVSGLGLQIAGMVTLGLWAKGGAGRRYGCLMALMGAAVVFAALFSLLSLAVVFQGYG